MTERAAAESPAADAAPASQPRDEGGDDSQVARLLEHVSTDPSSREKEALASEPSGLRSARVTRFDPKTCEIEVTMRGARKPIRATIDEGVETEVVERAAEGGDLVLVEAAPGEVPVVVGVLMTRIPRNTVIRGETITIEADREVLLRAGSAAVRLREDGEIEVVGSRVSTFSRGVLRLVGRVLRLN